MNLNEKLATIQTKFKSKKSRFNSFGKYYFRSAEDILEATKPFLLELGVSVIIKEDLIQVEPSPILKTTATLSDGENELAATAVVGVDMDQKGMQIPQKFGAASSYGKKYALGNLFLIDDTQDADASNDHNNNGVVSKLKKKAKQAMTVDQMKKATEYVAAGGNVDAIKSKYKLTAAQEKELNGQKADPYTTS
jgi:hypothetical protein